MASLSDISRHAGVSIATCSRVLNGSAHPVSEATRTRVLDAAQELGYAPSALARALVTRSSRIIGVIVGDIVDPYFAEIARGVEEVGADLGYLTMVCSAEVGTEAELGHLRQLRDYHAAGIVFAGSGRSNDPAAPDLADAVADGLAGDGTGMVELADQYLSGADFDVYFAVNCLDWEWPEDPEELLDAGTAAATESPHFAGWVVNDYVRCAMWPVEEEPMTAVTAPDAPPILVVSTTNDPATPYEAGVRTAERLASGVLLTYEGDGHTVVGNGVPCVDDIARAYLVDLEVPEDGTTC